MIAKITGKLDTINLTEVVIDVNGIGYEIIIPLSTYDNLPREGSDISLFTYMNVREDAITLYGFSTVNEKHLYKILITVSGIGPKLALKILSSVSINSFCEYVVNSNIKALMRINGLGKKSSERIVVELRDKIAAFAPEIMYKSESSSQSMTKTADEAVLALVQLGFKYEVAKRTVVKIASSLSVEEANSENLIRKALQSLNS